MFSYLVILKYEQSCLGVDKVEDTKGLSTLSVSPSPHPSGNGLLLWLSLIHGTTHGFMSQVYVVKARGRLMVSRLKV